MYGLAPGLRSAHAISDLERSKRRPDLSQPVREALAETTFTYDDVGNRLTETIDGATDHYRYNSLDQLLGTCDAEWDGTACTSYDTAYTYDGRGNLDLITEGIEVTDFTFDAADQLAGVEMPGGTQVTFAYDADGQRVSQTADGQSIAYLWDASSAYGDVVLETDGSGTPLAAYTLANGQLIAQTRGGVPWPIRQAPSPIPTTTPPLASCTRRPAALTTATCTLDSSSMR